MLQNYLCFDSPIIEKIRQVAKNGTAYNYYYVDSYSLFDKNKLAHWVSMDDVKGLYLVYNYNTKNKFTGQEFAEAYNKSGEQCKKWLRNVGHSLCTFDQHTSELRYVLSSLDEQKIIKGLYHMIRGLMLMYA